MVTSTSLSGAGELSRCRENVWLVFSAKPPHPDDWPVGVAATVKVTGVDVAVPPEKELTVSQAGGAFVLSSTVNGVPPVAAEVTDTVCAGLGVQVGVELGLV